MNINVIKDAINKVDVDYIDLYALLKSNENFDYIKDDLIDNNNIVSLSIGCNNLNEDIGIIINDIIIKNLKIKNLYLNQNNLKNGINDIIKNINKSNIEYLDLSDNNINDIIIKEFINQLKNYFDLINNDNEFEYKKNHLKIKFIDLKLNKYITNDSIELLIDFIKHTDEKILINLNKTGINNNGLDKIYTTYQKHFIVINGEKKQKLKKQPSRSIVSFRKQDILDKIDDNGVLDFFDQELSDLLLADIKRHIDDIKHINKIELSDNNLTHLAGKDIGEIIENNKNIHTILVDYNDIRQGIVEIAECLQNNKHFKKLNISHNEIKDSYLINFFKYLNNNEFLEELYLSDNNGITDESIDLIIDYVKNHKNIKILDINRTGLSIDNIKKVDDIIKTHKEI